jgi:hypothetical protein
MLMKLKTLAAFILLLSAAMALASEPNAVTTFEKMKQYAGKWQVIWEGKPMTTTMAVISEGSALMQSEEQENMVSMFHLDGPRLMLTHYCAAKNQPRLVGTPRPDGSIEFKFLDATNLTDPDTGHMHRMILTFKDADHFTEEWFFSKDGKEGKGETFLYTRKK